MRRALAAALVALGLVACTTDTTEQANHYDGYETGAYQIITQDGDIEIRDYPSVIVAEVSVAGDRDQAVNAGFRILAGYIFGKNEPQAKIAMTTPVTQQATLSDGKGETIAMTTPVTQSQQGNQWLVQFMMPSQYTLATLPKPKDDRIRFYATAPQRIIALRFSGFWTDRNLWKQLARLQDYVAAKGIATTGPHRYAYYNSPFTLPFLRRNEVMLTVVK
jgi:hypothetical protein